MKRLYCEECLDYLYYDEFVYLDEYNAITHYECYTGDIPRKDVGTYYEIVFKYDFLERYRPFFPIKKHDTVRHFVYVIKGKENDSRS